MLKKIKPYIVSVIIALAVGGLSALFTMENMDLYSTINKPVIAPPAIVFPIVWTILYVLMGISSANVYVNREVNEKAASKGLWVYAASLIVNFFWSIIFFNMREFVFAFIWLILLLILVIVTIINYKKVKPLAAYLQIPYIIWLFFAGLLNILIVYIN